MSKVSDYEHELVIKLLNSLKGSALFIKEANEKMMSNHDKLEAMKAVEALKIYIENYEENTRLLKAINQPTKDTDYIL